MAQAVICPVCNGSGQALNANREPPMQSCCGCGGKDWVEVGDGGLPFPVPYYPYPQPPELPGYYYGTWSGTSPTFTCGGAGKS